MIIKHLPCSISKLKKKNSNLPILTLSTSPRLVIHVGATHITDRTDNPALQYNNSIKPLVKSISDYEDTTTSLDAPISTISLTITSQTTAAATTEADLRAREKKKRKNQSGNEAAISSSSDVHTKEEDLTHLKEPSNVNRSEAGEKSEAGKGEGEGSLTEKFESIIKNVEAIMETIDTDALPSLKNKLTNRSLTVLNVIKKFEIKTIEEKLKTLTSDRDLQKELSKRSKKGKEHIKSIVNQIIESKESICKNIDKAINLLEGVQQKKEGKEVAEVTDKIIKELAMGKAEVIKPVQKAKELVEQLTKKHPYLQEVLHKWFKA